MRSVRAGSWVVAAWLALGCGSDGDDDRTDATDGADAAEAGEADTTDTSGETPADDAGPGETSGDTVGETPDHGGGEAADVPRDGTPPATAPICEGGTGSGTRRRWVDPVSGFEYCEAPCRGCTAECRGVGTAEEGWYAACADPTTEAGCGEAPGRIVLVDCG